MTIAEKIERAKQDIENAYNRGYFNGGGTLELESKSVIPSLEYQTIFPTSGHRLVYVSVYPATEVHDAAFASGRSQGAIDERTAFWNVFQNNGEPADYSHAFSYNKFSDETYNPIHDIVCENLIGGSAAQGMFIFNKSITNTKVPIYTQKNNLEYAFYGCENLRKIVLLGVTEVTTYANAFYKCESLIYIRVEGVIANDISFEDCPLTVESAWSVYSALKDFSGTGTTHTLTFSKATKNLLDVPKYDEAGDRMDSDWEEMVFIANEWGWIIQEAT